MGGGGGGAPFLIFFYKKKGCWGHIFFNETSACGKCTVTWVWISRIIVSGKFLLQKYMKKHVID
jgi:hypothetical protein